MTEAMENPDVESDVGSYGEAGDYESWPNEDVDPMTEEGAAAMRKSEAKLAAPMRKIARRYWESE